MSFLEVYGYNAGKGECIRIHFGAGRNVFVDTGTRRFGTRFRQICEEIISSEEPLDLLILTHSDDDHIGGITSMLRSGWTCPFTTVRMNHTGTTNKLNVQLSTESNDEVYWQLTKQGIEVLPMVVGDVIHIENAIITTYCPANPPVPELRTPHMPLAFRKDYHVPLKRLADMPIRHPDNSASNRSSIVFTFEQDGKKLLFTGDAWGDDIVRSLGDSPHSFDLVKLPHHGAVGNLSEDFEDMILCQRFLICADGIMHPDKQTIAKLEKWYGTITIYSPSNWWSSNFFTPDDDRNSISLIQQERIVFE